MIVERQYIVGIVNHIPHTVHRTPHTTYVLHTSCHIRSRSGRRLYNNSYSMNSNNSYSINSNNSSSINSNNSYSIDSNNSYSIRSRSGRRLYFVLRGRFGARRRRLKVEALQVIRDFPSGFPLISDSPSLRYLRYFPLRGISP